MGWSYYPYNGDNNSKDRLEECRRHFGGNPEWAIILKDAIVGTTYYAAMKSTESGLIWGLVALTDIYKGEFGYKSMDETMGPCYYDCPSSILKLLSPTDRPFALEWRERCYEAINHKKRIRQLTKALKTAQRISVTLPMDFNGNIYKPGETVELTPYTQGRWVDWVNSVAFRSRDLLKYGYTVIK